MHVHSCQEALWQAAEEGRDTLWEAYLKLGQLTHAAYDCPKKHASEDVLRQGRAVLAAAGLRRKSRITWESAWKLATSDLPTYQQRPWEATRLQRKVEKLGMVWLPLKRVVLGRKAGA